VRIYDPETGRFTQMDPASDGMNWYAYSASRPLVMVDPAGMRAEGLNDKQWKVLRCHLAALSKCFQQNPPRGRDWGYEELGRDITRFKDARGKYRYDGELEHYAETMTLFGAFIKMTFGKPSASALNGCCQYDQELAKTIVHEFTHLHDEYWEKYWIPINAEYLNYFPGEDMEMFHEAIAQRFVGFLSDCIGREVRKCCKRQ